MDLRLRNTVNKVILVYRDEHDHRRVRTVFRRNRKSKGGTEPVRSLGRFVRKLVSGGEKGMRTYLDRHDDSNRDKRDGWLRELSYNVYRAVRRGTRKTRRSVGLPSVEID